jgi:hypothetical protein
MAAGSATTSGACCATSDAGCATSGAGGPG